MKLGVHKYKCSKVTEPIFSRKNLIFTKIGKRVQNGLFALLCKIELLLFARNDLKMKHNNMLGWLTFYANPISGKIHVLNIFGKNGPKRAKIGFLDFCGK